MHHVRHIKQMATNTPAQAGTDAGAVSHEEMDWDSINWNAAHQNMRRLQMCIIKATKAGRWGKAFTLQRLLTHSFSCKALAVKQVTENQGRKTPGWMEKSGPCPARKPKRFGASN